MELWRIGELAGLTALCLAAYWRLGLRLSPVAPYLRLAPPAGFFGWFLARYNAARARRRARRPSAVFLAVDRLLNGPYDIGPEGLARVTRRFQWRYGFVIAAAAAWAIWG
jgi:hypothetical protein